MKKFVKYPSSVNAATKWSSHEEWLDAYDKHRAAEEEAFHDIRMKVIDEASKRFGIDLDEHLFDVLKNYKFWITEGYKKNIPVEELFDYIVSRTADNPKSAEYGTDVPYELQDVIDLLGSTREAHLLAQYLAREDSKRTLRWIEENKFD